MGFGCFFSVFVFLADFFVSFFFFVGLFCYSGL